MNGPALAEVAHEGTRPVKLNKSLDLAVTRLGYGEPVWEVDCCAGKHSRNAKPRPGDARRTGDPLSAPHK